MGTVSKENISDVLIKVQYRQKKFLFVAGIDLISKDTNRSNTRMRYQWLAHRAF